MNSQKQITKNELIKDLAKTNRVIKSAKSVNHIPSVKKYVQLFFTKHPSAARTYIQYFLDKKIKEIND